MNLVLSSLTFPSPSPFSDIFPSNHALYRLFGSWTALLRPFHILYPLFQNHHITIVCSFVFHVCILWARPWSWSRSNIASLVGAQLRMERLVWHQLEIEALCPFWIMVFLRHFRINERHRACRSGVGLQLLRKFLLTYCYLAATGQRVYNFFGIIYLRSLLLLHLYSLVSFLISSMHFLLSFR